VHFQLFFPQDPYLSEECFAFSFAVFFTTFIIGHVLVDDDGSSVLNNCLIMSCVYKDRNAIIST
jgi:hypothetical protein